MKRCDNKQGDLLWCLGHPPQRFSIAEYPAHEAFNNAIQPFVQFRDKSVSGVPVYRPSVDRRQYIYGVVKGHSCQDSARPTTAPSPTVHLTEPRRSSNLPELTIKALPAESWFCIAPPSEQ
jgi:hypothetical protein